MVSPLGTLVNESVRRVLSANMIQPTLAKHANGIHSSALLQLHKSKTILSSTKIDKTTSLTC